MNLPLGAAGYDAAGPFASPDDIVHAIRRCIDVLERPADDPRFPRAFALRFLVHLVGDVHQPLHVGTGFYRFGRRGTAPILVTDPGGARGATHDQGGNLLCYDRARCDRAQLHALWDVTLVESLARSSNDAPLTALLHARLADDGWERARRERLEPPSGDHRTWAAAWATATVREARGAYEGLVPGAESLRSGRPPTILVRLPEDYVAIQRDRATTQLAAAAVHLARLLDRIAWPR